MNEKYVQVPVSLIERIDSAYNASSDTLAALIEQLWMIAQPTPTSEPPRIEDMAPGTQAELDGDAFGRFVDSFNGDEAGDIEFVSALDGRVGYAMVGGNDVRAVFEHAVRAIDPSTIRDVQPPKEAA